MLHRIDMILIKRFKRHFVPQIQAKSYLKQQWHVQKNKCNAQKFNDYIEQDAGR